MQRLLLLDDHQLFVDGFKLIVTEMRPRLYVDTLCVAQEIERPECQLDGYDLILVDLHMPEVSGVSVVASIQRRAPKVKLAVISGTQRKDDIERILSFGVLGFISKDASAKMLVAAIDTLLIGRRYLPPALAHEIRWPVETISRHDSIALLTRRQREVVSLIATGKQNKQIASELSISSSVVKFHIENIFRRLNVKNRTACVQMARDLGLI